MIQRGKNQSKPVKGKTSKNTASEFKGHVKPPKQASVTFISPVSESHISPIALTKAHFLDVYSKGKWNLSNVPCPPCFQDVGLLMPPECYSESTRRQAVEKYMKQEHWNDKFLFKKIIGNLRKTFSVGGVSISLIETQRTLIKIETLMDMGDIPRSVSLDAHTILSQGYFLLLDASQDWRTSRNPFVTGVPYIKFYCGVPLMTSKREIIGVLAIFDSCAKPDFPEEACKKLISFSREVMTLLDTPVIELRQRYKLRHSSSSNSLDSNLPHNNELNELSLKLGRATSNKSILKTVFEKDGSGGPYSQNQNFRFTKLVKDSDKEGSIDGSSELGASGEEAGVNNKYLWDKLFRIGSMKNAAMALTKSICLHYKVDFAYILEIRIAESYLIPQEFFPRSEIKIEAENYRYADKLINQSDLDNEFMTRIIGIYGSSHTSLNFENSIHHKAFTSEFGIRYANVKNNSIYNKGIIMPFYRHNSKLVRKTKERCSKAGRDHSEKEQLIDVYLRSGGYLIALFNKNIDTEFSPTKISNVFTNTCNLRKIYITA